LEATSVSEDDQKPRRRASERAVDPVSRVLLATAEGHQEYIDRMGQPVPWWRDWLYYWVVGGAQVVSGAVALVFYLMQWFVAALPLSALLLVLGAVILAYPWMHRGRGRTDRQPGERQDA
jgi:hypothetical protein